MTATLNAVVLGNCQARPIATFLSEMTSGSVYTPLIAHLSSSEDQEKDFELLSKADLILTQPIANEFKAKHLATSQLRQQFADKVVTWPNLFFSGQTPDTLTMKNLNGVVIKGPLETYQSAGVVNCWQRNMSAIDATRYLLDNLPMPSKVLGTTVEETLSELKRRSADSDISIVDYIINNIQTERLFFTFNHPTSRLLIKVCELLCSYCDIPVHKKIISEFWEEPLGRLTAPITTPLAEFLNLKFPHTAACRGREISVVNGDITLGANKIYAFDEFVHATFLALDTQITKSEPLSFTPTYASIKAAA